MSKKYYVASGKSVSLKRGIAVSGEEVTYLDLPDPVSAKQADGFTEKEIDDMKKVNFKALVGSKKGILVAVKPEPESKVVELDVRPDTQEVDLSVPSKAAERKEEPKEDTEPDKLSESEENAESDKSSESDESAKSDTSTEQDANAESGQPAEPDENAAPAGARRQAPRRRS